ncbi:hypothetical protein FPOAC1_009661 [Fusarium poae]|uniref:hypothetical protein n=1 Tax=Fusarium poae TaxID=36050 RepID=UPI001CEA479C|nr:hypothetical protein FPOAC1_009661 [Fusarium poae]KAG8670254.1 hypothetical protein FPOAC1_009661 [Fusarium poae]
MSTFTPNNLGILEEEFGEWRIINFGPFPAADDIQRSSAVTALANVPPSNKCVETVHQGQKAQRLSRIRNLAKQVIPSQDAQPTNPKQAKKKPRTKSPSTVSFRRSSPWAT